MDTGSYEKQKSGQGMKINVEDAKQEDIKHIINDRVGVMMKYGQGSFLDGSEDKKSSDFLDLVSYSVQLSELYKIVDACSYHEKMPCCAILVENIWEEKNRENS